MSLVSIVGRINFFQFLSVNHEPGLKVSRHWQRNMAKLMYPGTGNRLE
jgi:hypothetical protein